MYKYYTPERQCVTCVTNFWILIISIHTCRLGNRIKQIWQPLLFINGYLRRKCTFFHDFARKIQRLAPPTGRPGRAQSGRTPEFGYGPLYVRQGCVDRVTTVHCRWSKHWLVFRMYIEWCHILSQNGIIFSYSLIKTYTVKVEIFALY